MRKTLYAVIAIVMMIALMTGCSFKTTDSTGKGGAGNELTGSSQNNGSTGETDKIALTLYFANEDNSAIPTEIREVQLKDNDIVKTAIEEFLKGPESANLRKTVPEGTKLLGYEKKDDLVVVNFSREYENVNDIAEVVERISLVNTLTGIDGVKRVKIQIEGKDLIGASGEPFGELSRAALDQDGRPIPGEAKKVKLYFGDSDAELLVGETRDVTINEGESAEKAIVNELIKGPSDSSLSPTVPAGTKLLSSETRDGICTLNFSKELIDNHPGGSAGEIMTLYSIVDSLTELEGIKKVQFLIDGEKRDSFIHLVLDEPIDRDESIIGK